MLQVQQILLTRGSKIITGAIRGYSHRSGFNRSNVSRISHMQSLADTGPKQHCYTTHRKPFTLLVLPLYTSLFHSGHSLEEE